MEYQVVSAQERLVTHYPLRHPGGGDLRGWPLCRAAGDRWHLGGNGAIGGGQPLGHGSRFGGSPVP